MRNMLFYTHVVTRWLLPAACIGLLPFSVQAAPQGPAIGIGLYVSNVPGASRSDRIQAIEQLAKLLTNETGMSFKGRSFARETDLFTSSRKGTIKFAIIPAGLALERKWRILATATGNSGKTKTSWSVLAPSRLKSLQDLKGKTLTIPRISDADKRFALNVLFEGELNPSYFRWLRAPDAASALRAVKLGKAAAAVLPAISGSSHAGLYVVFQSQPIPLPVFAATGKVKPGIVTRIKKH